jgi:hypothetical protein
MVVYELFAFKKSGKFCQNNWNDPLCMKLRQYYYDYVSDKGSISVGDFDLYYEWYNEETYLFIEDKKNEFRYLMTWYKQRRATGIVLFQGDPITRDEMEYLLKGLKVAFKKNKVKRNKKQAKKKDKI